MLWKRLREGVGQSPAGVEALQDLQEDPTEQGNRDALMNQVRKVIAKDVEIQSPLAEALASGTLGSVQSATADRGGRVTKGGRVAQTLVAPTMGTPTSSMRTYPATCSIC